MAVRSVSEESLRFPAYSSVHQNLILQPSRAQKKGKRATWRSSTDYYKLSASFFLLAFGLFGSYPAILLRRGGTHRLKKGKKKQKAKNRKPQQIMTTHYSQKGVWSWLRMNAGDMLNTCKSNVVTWCVLILVHITTQSGERVRNTWESAKQYG